MKQFTKLYNILTVFTVSRLFLKHKLRCALTFLAVKAVFEAPPENASPSVSINHVSDKTSHFISGEVQTQTHSIQFFALECACMVCNFLVKVVCHFIRYHHSNEVVKGVALTSFLFTAGCIESQPDEKSHLAFVHARLAIQFQILHVLSQSLKIVSLSTACLTRDYL